MNEDCAKRAFEATLASQLTELSQQRRNVLLIAGSMTVLLLLVLLAVVAFAPTQAELEAAALRNGTLRRR